MKVKLRNGEVVNAYGFDVKVCRITHIYYVVECLYIDELFKQNVGDIRYTDDVNEAMDEKEILENQLNEEIKRLSEKSRDFLQGVCGK